MTRKTSTPATNLALLQWLVVDGTAPCIWVVLLGQTRQSLSDKSATASNADRYRSLKEKQKQHQIN